MSFQAAMSPASSAVAPTQSPAPDVHLIHIPDSVRAGSGFNEADDKQHVNHRHSTNGDSSSLHDHVKEKLQQRPQSQSYSNMNQPSGAHTGYTFTTFSTVLEYLRLDWLGAAITLHLIAATMYFLEDLVHAVVPPDYFAKKATQTYFFDVFNCAAASLFVVDSLLYRQAYHESRKLHAEGHASSDIYQICEGKADSPIGVVAYALNVIASCGYLATAFLAIYGDSKGDITNQVDLYSYFINSLNMLMFTVSSCLFSYIWFSDRGTWAQCKHQAPKDLNFMSQAVDTIGSLSYTAFLLYGTTMRILIAGYALQQNDANLYPTLVKTVTSREYALYIIGDTIYLIAPIALYADYWRMKSKAIQKEHERKQNAASADPQLHQDDLRTALLAGGMYRSPSYGSRAPNEDPLANPPSQQESDDEQHADAADEQKQHDSHDNQSTKKSKRKKKHHKQKH